MSEKAWQAQVVQLARMLGWRVHHARAAMNRNGKWATPIQGHPGFPDLVLVRERGVFRVVFAELKRQGGRLQPDQREWLRLLRAAGAEVYVWRPGDLEAVQAVLTAAEAPGHTQAPPDAENGSRGRHARRRGISARPQTDTRIDTPG
jgi:hypothetical protein